jgi:hypothetical protein
MATEIVFVPDPFLEEGPTTVRDMIRAARTRHSAAPPAPIAAGHPERRPSMAQRQPQPQHDAAPMARWAPTPIAHVGGSLARYVQEALDPLDDELAFVEEATLLTGATVSRMYQGSDQLIQSTLQISRGRRAAGGFADAEDEFACRARDHRFEAEMEAIYADGSYAARAALRATLDQGPAPPRPRAKIAVYRRDGGGR